MTTDGKISLAVLAGDGIGPEITEATVRVLEAAAARTTLDLALTLYPIGWKAYEKSRSTLMPETVAALRNHMGWILGPTFAGEYPKDDPINGHPSGYLRRNFALLANVRPVQAWPQADPLVPDLDITILRENTEGFIRTAISPGAMRVQADRGCRAVAAGHHRAGLRPLCPLRLRICRHCKYRPPRGDP